MEIRLWNGAVPFALDGADTPNSMHTYFIKTEKPLPCVVVLPGGAYAVRADHEGGPIAEFFNEKGYHAVVVNYRVSPNRHPAPLADVQRAVRILRANADEWRIDPNRVIVLGFSAGGHLAASSIVLDAVETEKELLTDAIDGYDCRPNGAILCYPVISVDSDYGHVGSGKNLLGEHYGEEKDAFCLANKINESTPKAFLWHTSDDASVNVKNSLYFAEQLRDHGIRFELHVYPHGPHGLGLAQNYPDVRAWAELAADWIKREF